MSVIYFYGPAGSYGFLSNFFPSTIELGGAEWPTVEHYYQARKFDEAAQREVIRTSPTAGKAKRLARAAAGTVRPDWEAVREQVMLAGLRAKFNQHRNLAGELLNTGDSILVEHTSRDSYWGDGGDGSGANRLGALLMQVRAEINEIHHAADSDRQQNL